MCARVVFRFCTVCLVSIFLLAPGLTGCDSDSATGDPPDGGATADVTTGAGDVQEPDVAAPDIAVAEDVSTPSDIQEDTEPAQDVPPPDDVIVAEDVSPLPDTQDVGEPWGPPELAATRAAFEFSARPALLPYPYDYYLTPDPTSLSGQRVRYDDEAYSNAIIRPILTLTPVYKAALNQLEGFSPYGWNSIELTGPLPADFEQLPREDLPADAPIQLLLWDGEQVTGRVPFWTRFVEYEGQDFASRYNLDLLPFRPLPDGTRYLVVVTRDLLDADGAPVGPDADFVCLLDDHPLPPEPARRDAILAERERLQPALAALAAAGYAPEDLAIAFDVTVGPVRADLFAIGQRYQEDASLQQVAYDLDPDGDGVDNVYYPGDPGYPGGLGDTAVYITGTYERRDFRNPAIDGGTFQRDDQGQPVIDHLHKVEFYFALPNGAANTPSPVTLCIHGIESKKEHVRRLVAPLAAEGLAALAMDLPKHGNDGAGGVDFLSLTSPLAGRDNFRQAAVDILTARYLVQTWADEGLDLVPRGGDGVPDIDPSRLTLIGHSLGTMTGSMAMSLDQQPEAGVLAVGGGGIFHFIQSFLNEYGFAALIPERKVHALEIYAGHAWEGGDPITYFGHVTPHVAPWVERTHQVNLLELLGDTTMPEKCLEAAAAAMELELLGPELKSIEGIPTCQEERPSTALTLWNGGSHNIYSGPDAPAVIPQAVHFIKTFLETGTGEIIHPWE